MSRTDIARVTVKRGEARTRGSTDWKRIDAMTDEEATANARDDPDAQPLSEERLAKMRWVSRVKVLRQRLGMTQAEFAAAFHLPIGTLRDWEQHQSNPDAPARALLLAIERDPERMRQLLAGTSGLADMVPIGVREGMFDSLVSLFGSHRAWEEIDRKTQRLYEHGLSLVANRVLKDGARVGSKQLADFTRGFADAIYTKLLVVKETDADGKPIKRERRERLRT
jgi:putative transcriptional regulator